MERNWLREWHPDSSAYSYKIQVGDCER